MCVALPGKVVEVMETEAIVDFTGNRVKAQSGLVDVKVGDYCLVHAGCILQVLNKQEAENMIDLFKEIEELSKL